MSTALPVYKVRFNLQNGPHKGHWQVTARNGQVDYYDPATTRLELNDCKLINKIAVAERIFTRKASKQVCAWVEAKRLIIRKRPLNPDGSRPLRYNPQVCPTWRVGHQPNHDGLEVTHIFSVGNHLYSDDMTKADQMREMLAKGHTDAEIIKKLDASPGHLRQVKEAMKAKTGTDQPRPTSPRKSSQKELDELVNRVLAFDDLAMGKMSASKNTTRGAANSVEAAKRREADFEDALAKILVGAARGYRQMKKYHRDHPKHWGDDGTLENLQTIGHWMFGDEGNLINP